jgi:hypothetical protein
MTEYLSETHRMIRDGIASGFIDKETGQAIGMGLFNLVATCDLTLLPTKLEELQHNNDFQSFLQKVRPLIRTVIDKTAVENVELLDVVIDCISALEDIATNHATATPHPKWWMGTRRNNPRVVARGGAQGNGDEQREVATNRPRNRAPEAADVEDALRVVPRREIDAVGLARVKADLEVRRLELENEFTLRNSALGMMNEGILAVRADQTRTIRTIELFGAVIFCMFVAVATALHHMWDPLIKAFKKMQTSTEDSRELWREFFNNTKINNCPPFCGIVCSLINAIADTIAKKGVGLIFGGLEALIDTILESTIAAQTITVAGLLLIGLVFAFSMYAVARTVLRGQLDFSFGLFGATNSSFRLRNAERDPDMRMLEIVMRERPRDDAMITHMEPVQRRQGMITHVEPVQRRQNEEGDRRRPGRNDPAPQRRQSPLKIDQRGGTRRIQRW